jgi:hypothetical protein
VLDGTSAEAVQDMPQLLALLRRGHLQKRQVCERNLVKEITAISPQVRGHNPYQFIFAIVLDAPAFRGQHCATTVQGRTR